MNERVPAEADAIGGQRVIRIERHELGPRFYLFGRRVHECWAGLALLAAAGAVALAHMRLPMHLMVVFLAIGAWMLAKDWRDFFPSRRDTAAWRIGLHRRPSELREARRGDWVPPLLGSLAAAVALANVASTLTPSLGDRVRVLREVTTPDMIPVAHAVALPVAVALLVGAVGLLRRRRHAWALAAALLAVLGLLNLLKGLDVEEAAACWALAGLLVWSREAFHVRGCDVSLRRALYRAPIIAGAAFLVALAAVWAARGHATPRPDLALAVEQAGGLLILIGGPLDFHGQFAWLPAGVGALGITATLAAILPLFRPLALPHLAPGPINFERARSLVRRHGRDSLSFFKLRGDAAYLFAEDGRAFLAYRIESGVLVVSGDPVGPEDALPGLVRDLFAMAEAHGLRVCVLGASEALLPLYRQAGLRAMYLGDEALVDTAAFSLVGRPIRKVRQSVTRLEKAGYTIAVHQVGELGPEELAALEGVSERWRGGDAERGFTMCMDALGGEHQAESVVVLARDADGVARGFLHFVPCYGRAAMSLSAMRRDPDTPNGLTEFLVARGIELLRERGVAEVSLNFATFARWLHAPRTRVERILGRIVSRLNPHFQIESLYRFNAKFFPRWEPRYMCFEGLGLMRAGLAALWTEGQLPRPRMPRAPAILRRVGDPEAGEA